MVKILKFVTFAAALLIVAAFYSLTSEEGRANATDAVVELVHEAGANAAGKGNLGDAIATSAGSVKARVGDIRAEAKKRAMGGRK